MMAVKKQKESRAKKMEKLKYPYATIIERYDDDNDSEYNGWKAELKKNDA